eukprot:GGOE01018084.1.p1 GENE.GGOE01018084.1~~GGOE01018084.1.p1  ORF type:complete len:349 (+),score=47.80 GGOE01018084.1:37-1083(+)
MGRIVCLSIALFAIPCFLLFQTLAPEKPAVVEFGPDAVLISEVVEQANAPQKLNEIKPISSAANVVKVAIFPDDDGGIEDEGMVNFVLNNSHCPPLPYKPFGYQPRANLPRWTAICEELWADFQQSVGGRKKPVVFDYGSNQGFFSVSVAITFPQSLVISLDMHQTKERNIQGGHGGMDKKAGKSHYKVIETHAVKNNVICDIKFGPETFELLSANGIILDYQLTLSVFHWLPITSRTHFEQVLAAHLRNARTTFLELPSPIQKPCANYLSYKRWYDGRKNVSLIILQSCQRQGLMVRLKQITPSYKPEHRVVFRIDVVDASPTPFLCNQTCLLLGCRADTPFASCPR